MCSADSSTDWMPPHVTDAVESVRVGRELRYRVLGALLSETAQRLDRIGAEWDRRLATIKRIAEEL